MITSDDAQQVIHDLLEVLAAAGLVTKVEDPLPARRRMATGFAPPG